MDNNLNNTPTPQWDIQPPPNRPTDKLLSIGLSLLKAIGYVGIWLAVQTVLVTVFTVVVAIDNRGLSQKELSDLVTKYSIELTLITNLITLGIFVVIFLLLRKSFLARIKANTPQPLTLAPTGILGVSAQFSTLFILGLLMAFFPADWIESMEQNSEIMNNANQTVVFITTVIMAPIFEEIMCRGLILGTLRKSMNKWVAIVLSALIFGVIHGNAIQIIYATALGILLGWIYTKTNSIFIPMLCHLTFNLTSTLLQYVNTENPIMAVILTLIMIGSLPITVLCILFFWFKKSPLEDKMQITPTHHYTTYTSYPEYNESALSSIKEQVEGSKNNENGD